MTGIHGRGREITLLRGFLDELREGTGGLVLIGGEAGIGKTTLVEHILKSNSANDLHTLFGRCYDLEAPSPFGPWREIGRHLKALDTGIQLPEFLGGEPVERGATGQAGLYDSLAEQLASHSDQAPVVLALEDLHWADPESLDLLRVVARLAPSSPLLILATYRDDAIGPEHPLYSLLPAFVREARAELLNLRRLDREAIEDLVATRYDLNEADRARLIDHLAQVSDGNPLFLTEQLRTLEEERTLRPSAGGWVLDDIGHLPLTPLVRQTIEGRLRHLSDADRKLLAVAAIIGPAIRLNEWAETVGADPDTLSDLIQRARRQHILIDDDDFGSYRFSHSLVRQELYESSAPFERQQWHVRCAERLLRLENPDPDRVADHLWRGDDPRAWTWLMAAAEYALELGARSTSAERVERALGAMETHDAPASERAYALGRLAWLTEFNNPVRSLALLDEAIALRTTHSNDLLSVGLLAQRGQQRAFFGDLQGAMADLEEARPLFQRSSTGKQERPIRGESPTDDPTIPLIVACSTAGQYEQGIALAEERLGGRIEDMQERWNRMGFSLSSLARCAAETGQPDLARRLHQQSLIALQDVPDPVIKAAANFWSLHSVYMPYFADDLPAVTAVADAAYAYFEAASRQGDVGRWPSELARIELMARRGEWERIEQTARPVGPGQVNVPTRHYIASIMAENAFYSGNSERAHELIREILPAGPQTEPGEAVYAAAIQVQRLAARLHLYEGDREAAQAWIDANARWLDWTTSIPGRTWHEILLATAARVGDDLEAARCHLNRALEMASCPRQPPPLQRARRLLGEIELESGNLDAAEDHLQIAGDLARAMEDRYEAALTDFAVARLLLARGASDDAHSLLRDVRESLAAIGARPALSRIDELIGETAGRPAAGLTPREMDVLRLLATGMTNPEIAEQLYISRRTVDQHLRRIYAKMNVSSRTAATRFAIEHDLI